MSAAAQPDRTTPMRVIKKYPNRRLYDTQASAYITLAQIKALVLQHEQLRVQDAKTGADLTRAIFLQIILEEEAAGTPMFSEALLANLIRVYGQTMQSHMGPFLEQQLQMLADWQTRSAEQVAALTPQAWTQLLQKWPQASAGALLEPSARAMEQMHQHMHQQVQKNTEQMLAAMGLKR